MTLISSYNFHDPNFFSGVQYDDNISWIASGQYHVYNVTSGAGNISACSQNMGNGTGTYTVGGKLIYSFHPGLSGQSCNGNALHNWYRYNVKFTNPAKTTWTGDLYWSDDNINYHRYGNANSHSGTSAAFPAHKDGVVVAAESNFDFSINAFPNPVSENVTLNYSLSDDVSNLNISVYNVMGQKVSTIFNGAQDAGNNILNWNIDEQLSNGIYIIKLTDGVNSTSIKLSVVK